MHGIEKLPPTNVNPQDGLDIAAELAVNSVTAPLGLDSFEASSNNINNYNADETSADVALTTANGHEITNSREKLDVEELETILEEYDLGGESPKERVLALRMKSKESFALFLTDLNRRLQGSDETLIDDQTMKIGGKETISPEDRYDLFSSIYEKIQNASDDTNPERIGDALALATVLLHPFKDGNGRTARMLGYIYRADFNDLEDIKDFETLAEPRDQARERGGWMINGYIPYIGEGADQSDPAEVEKFIDRILHEDVDGLYTGPYGQAPLSTQSIN